jgi:hypothetical protein
VAEKAIDEVIREFRQPGENEMEGGTLSVERLIKEALKRL